MKSLQTDVKKTSCMCVCKCTTVNCTLSAAHMAFRESCCQEQVSFDFICYLWKPLCCFCYMLLGQAVQKLAWHLYCVPPSAEQTLRPPDEEPAEVWTNQKSHGSYWSLIPNRTRTVWHGRKLIFFISSFHLEIKWL